MTESMVRTLATIVLLFNCAGSGHDARGEDRIERSEKRMAGGNVTVIWRSGQEQPPTSVWLHFHGATETLVGEWRQTIPDRVLVIVNFPGLSSAYRRPFQSDAKLLPRILHMAAAAVNGRGGPIDPSGAMHEWDRITLSMFSAGYGAVREILAAPSRTTNIDSVISCDSIYASLEEPGDQRRVNREQMAGFLRYARRAAEREAVFVIGHSSQPTPYASTTETAAYLLAETGLSRQPVEQELAPQFVAKSRARLGNFLVLAVAGESAEDHLRHLRHIGVLWRIAADWESSQELPNPNGR